jgi:chromosome segregation ATPase
MNTDNKTGDENQITSGENSTLHNAGVDVASSADENLIPKEEFVDIDNAPIIGQDEDLKKLGVEVAPTQNKEDLSLLKEQMDKKEFAGSSVASVFKDEQNIKPIVEASKQETPAPKPEVLKKPEPEKSESEISDLENEFNKTVGQRPSSSEKGNLNEKITSLEAMLIKIKEKLGFKKKEVKEELESLKKVKEDIEEDIANIKELEESKQKIEEKLGKVEAISGEISEIEKEVKEELKS